CMGAVLHTLNLRLFPEQIAYIVNHAEDSVIIVDASLASVLAPIVPKLTTVRHFIVIGDGRVRETHLEASRAFHAPYEELLAAEQPDFQFPNIDERSAAAMCYTSGTTGNPKGVVYSHRSIYLHSMASAMASGFALTCRDRALIIPSMFHANAW